MTGKTVFTTTTDLTEENNTELIGVTFGTINGLIHRGYSPN